MCDWPDFDVAPYAGLGMPDFVRRTYCSWDEAGWRSLVVQRFTLAHQVDHLPLPDVTDAAQLAAAAKGTGPLGGLINNAGEQAPARPHPGRGARQGRRPAAAPAGVRVIGEPCGLPHGQRMDARPGGAPCL